MSTRFIAVDDTSPRISYQGPWFQQSSNNSSPGGLSFKNTLTGIDESGSFSLDFTGTSVSVIGSFSNNVPTWTCSIDGNTLISTNISSVNMMENNIEICGLSSIKTSPSHLNVVVSASTNGIFYLDYIRYAPNASVILDDATVVYPNDSQIHYDSNWVSLNGKLETSGQNASMTFDCIGRGETPDPDVLTVAVTTAAIRSIFAEL